jgi:hypothetical protein
MALRPIAVPEPVMTPAKPSLFLMQMMALAPPPLPLAPPDSGNLEVRGDVVGRAIRPGNVPEVAVAVTLL